MVQRMVNAVTESAVADDPMVLVGCGILQNELCFLIEKNGWKLEPRFLQSALHNYLDRLRTELSAALDDSTAARERTIVFYGACHPQMDAMLASHDAVRTEGQNCIAMLLGFDLFMAELSNGTYFLLEEWARSWEPMITQCFGSNPAVIREIFHNSHTRMVALRTPCSGDFTAAAEAAARLVDLPLWWMDVSLDHLESVLAAAIERQRGRTE